MVSVSSLSYQVHCFRCSQWLSILSVGQDTEKSSELLGKMISVSIQNFKYLAEVYVESKRESSKQEKTMGQGLGRKTRGIEEAAMPGLG